jgi:hypothetical protein
LNAGGILRVFFTVYFCGQAYETAKKQAKRGKERDSEISSGISLAAIMPELSQAAKKFGSHSRHHISAWPKPSWPNFSKTIGNAGTTAMAKSVCQDDFRGSCRDSSAESR